MFYIIVDVFEKFLELHSTLSEKKICHEFPLLFNQNLPSSLFKWPKSAKRNKSILLMLP